jgi:hypothetical protein
MAAQSILLISMAVDATMTITITTGTIPITAMTMVILMAGHCGDSH